mmetsp:Transcript_9026/g.23333  ORF Transcript_9026/g.23333 Transcript_9026/m.23333 type:complete len:342 (+) Transcript_9026:735-1760(+)
MAAIPSAVVRDKSRVMRTKKRTMKPPMKSGKFAHKVVVNGTAAGRAPPPSSSLPSVWIKACSREAARKPSQSKCGANVKIRTVLDIMANSCPTDPNSLPTAMAEERSFTARPAHKPEIWAEKPAAAAMKRKATKATRLYTKTAEVQRPAYFTTFSSCFFFCSWKLRLSALCPGGMIVCLCAFSSTAWKAVTAEAPQIMVPTLSMSRASGDSLKARPESCVTKYTKGCTMAQIRTETSKSCQFEVRSSLWSEKPRRMTAPRRSILSIKPNPSDHLILPPSMPKHARTGGMLQMIMPKTRAIMTDGILALPVMSLGIAAYSMSHPKPPTKTANKVAGQPHFSR